MSLPLSLQSFLEPWLMFLVDNPLMRITQGAMLLLGALVIFLVFYATKDILLRTHSFFYMFLSIILVAALPLVGFLLYLLIRPARTTKEREVHAMLTELTKKLAKASAKKPKKKKVTKK